MNLREAATLWASPSAHDGRRPGAASGSTQGANLAREAEFWASPSATAWKGSTQPGQRRGQLSEQAETGPPDPASANGGAKSSPPARGSRRQLLLLWMLAWSKQNFVALSALLCADGIAANVAPPQGDLRRDLHRVFSTPRLNPMFAEALMGLRPGWTACEPSGTPSCPSAPPSPSVSLRTG